MKFFFFGMRFQKLNDRHNYTEIINFMPIKTLSLLFIKIWLLLFDWSDSMYLELPFQQAKQINVMCLCDNPPPFDCCGPSVGWYFLTTQQCPAALRSTHFIKSMHIPANTGLVCLKWVEFCWAIDSRENSSQMLLLYRDQACVSLVAVDVCGLHIVHFRSFIYFTLHYLELYR